MLRVLSTEEQVQSSRVVFLSGLPRSGSTLLCSLLGAHPRVRAGATSPLHGLVETLRGAWSDDPTLLAQLDADLDGVQQRLRRALRAFILAWSADPERPVTVDKGRGWLFSVELLRELFPDFRLIVCLRDLRDVWASVERQHRRTLLLAFPDRTEPNLVDTRAGQLFAPSGLIGAPLRALANLGDLPDLAPHLYFWRYEDFAADPAGSLGRLFAWLGLEPVEVDFERLPEAPPESDSHYRFKYPHRAGARFQPPAREAEELSPRILAAIATRFGWYYRAFYAPEGFRPAALRERPALEGGDGGFGLGLERG